MISEPKPQRVKSSVALRYVIVLQVLVFFLYSVPLSAVEKTTIPSEVQDLRYGVILYHFYQQSYFNALTESLVGEERADMPFHADSAKLLRGGMSLSYGMGHIGEQIFNQLLDTITDESKKNQAWFYLGKLYYLRANKAAAQQAFSHIQEQSIAQELKEEYIYYSASLFLQRGQVAEAEQKIQQLNKKSPWLSYYNFNRGAAQTVAGNWQQGVEFFQQIKDSPLNDAEGLVLKDRAYMASGFAYLGAQEFDSAIDDFMNVRLQSPLVDRAMLGYGWARTQQKEYRKALAPWQALSKRSVLSPSVQESLLAIPYVYEKIKAPASALKEYVHAAAILEKELGSVKEAIALFRNAPLSEIFTEQSELGLDWVGGDEYLPLNQQVPYLTHLIAQNRFQTAIGNRADLTRMKHFLAQSKESFSAMHDVLNLQKNMWQESLDNALREKYRERYQKLILAQKRLQETLLLAQQESDGRRLVDPVEQALWSRVEQAQKRLALLKSADMEVSEEGEALRLYRGFLLWRASENYSIKQWEFKQQFAELVTVEKEIKEKLERIEALSIDRFDTQFSERMSSMEQRIIVQANSVNQALEASESSIRTLAVKELLKQQKRLTYYLGRAKIAIARLYDAGSMEAEL